MNGDVSLWGSTLDQVREQLGVYQRVYVIDGTYHRAWGNLNELDRNGRSHVVGTQMRCGLHKPHADNWVTESTPIERAHEQAMPCSRCFEFNGGFVS